MEGPVQLSVVIITYNEEANIGRALGSVAPLVSGGKGEMIVVDSGSTDRTVEIARAHGAKVFVEPWKGYAAQKNSALEKACGEWILSLDADESLEPGLAEEIQKRLPDLHQSCKGHSHEWCRTMEQGHTEPTEKLQYLKGAPTGFWIPRKNFFLGRWIKHGGFWPDPKLRLFRRGVGQFEDRLVHEDVKLSGRTGCLSGAIVHYSYPTISDYIDHMNRYSSLGAEMAVSRGRHSFGVIHIVLRPLATFIYNYFFRLGFLDGREGLLLYLYHSAYVSWKYAKVWELSRKITPKGTNV